MCVYVYENVCMYICMNVGSMYVFAKSKVVPVVNELRNLLYYEVEADYDITNTREVNKRYPHIGLIV